ncbi:hypothetical protein Ajs_1555 [Acidovorax sp. JS42]|nr:hypothetical protein Ajs_1555 [Acidovorax sp. JS42]
MGEQEKRGRQSPGGDASPHGLMKDRRMPTHGGAIELREKLQGCLRRTMDVVNGLVWQRPGGETFSVQAQSEHLEPALKRPGSGRPHPRSKHHAARSTVDS